MYDINAQKYMKSRPSPAQARASKKNLQAMIKVRRIMAVEQRIQKATKLPMKESDRLDWLEYQTELVSVKFKAKFKNGQEEHGGDIGNVTISGLLDEVEHEALDQLAYVAELRRRLA